MGRVCQSDVGMFGLKVNKGLIKMAEQVKKKSKNIYSCVHAHTHTHTPHTHTLKSQIKIEKAFAVSLHKNR